MIRKKIVILGDFSVGKTSLIRRYVDGSFDDKYLSTIGVKISKKAVDTDSGSCELIIWDIEGNTPTKSIPLTYYKGASGAIFVVDVTRGETIEGLDAHISRFIQINPDAHYIVAYNKADMLDETQKDAFELDSSSFLTSAKIAQNVDSLFSRITQDMMV